MNISAILSGILGGGLFSAGVSVLAYRQNSASSTRESLFRCLDAYYKVMDYKLDAEKSGDSSAYITYYRSLFDLHWAEYQIWIRDAIADGPYRAWLNARFHDYEASVVRGSPHVSYRSVWEELIAGEYFIDEDFIAHMELAHKGHFERAMDQKYTQPLLPWPKFLRRRLNQ